MKKIKMMLVSALLISAFAVMGCSSNSDEAETDSEVAEVVTVADLPKSGATVDVKTTDDVLYVYQSLLYEISSDSIMNGLYKFADDNEEIISKFTGSRAALNDVVNEVQDMTKNTLTFVDALMQEGKGALELSLENVGEVEGLPNGLYLNIGAIDVNADVDLTAMNVEADAKLSFIAKVDTAEFLKAMEVSGESLIKGVVLKVNGKVDGSMSESDVSASEDIVLNAGVSFCLANGMGGSLIVSVELASNVDVDLSDTSAIMALASSENLNDMVETCKVNVAFYNDKGEKTLELAKVESVEDLLTVVAGYQTLIKNF